MAINLKAPDYTEVKPRILVVGVGGAGGNAVNNMVASKLEGVEFIVANTDAQALAHSKATYRVQIGSKLTSGLGAGSRPEIGTAAAEESVEELKACLAGSHMAFITAGMGGGTGTGAAPIIARIARELGVLTVGVVTKPFAFEGQRRMRIAEDGIHKLQEFVDTLIVIPNQNLFRVANEKTTFAKAFEIADDVLYSGVRGITDLMVMPGLINLDFGDVRTVMSEMGKAMMGTGEATGERRAIEAAEAAISNPLLDHSSMKGAKGVLINITGGMDLTLFEVDEAANKIRAEVDPEANIIVGSTFDEKLDGKMRVSVVATGISSEVKATPIPKMTSQVQVEAPRIVRPAVGSAPLAEPKIEIRRAPEMPIATAPMPEPRVEVRKPIDIPNPVHILQSEIMQAGLVSERDLTPIDAAPMMGKPSVLAASLRGHAESHDFDPQMIDALGPDPREAARQRIASHMRPTLRSEAEPQRKPKKRGGFNILGINIGGTSEPAAERPTRASSAASNLRLPTESPLMESGESRVLPATTRTKVAAEEVRATLSSEDQLEIPAFLRRQAN